MTEEQRRRIREELERERADLENRLQRNGHYGLNRGMNDSVGELSGYDNHPADLGTEMFERGKDIALNEQDQYRLEEIKEAIQRMKKGTYGQCIVCGTQIPFERLEAVPATLYCREHAPDSEVSERRPIEEQIIYPPFGEHFNDGNDERNAYDAEDAWQEVEQYGTSNPADVYGGTPNYNEVTIDHHERKGYSMDIEGFTITDAEGRTEEITDITHNDAYRRFAEKEE